jgi:RHS repeat-associated protein
VFDQLLTVSMSRPRVPGPGSDVTQTRTFVYDGNQRVQSVTNPENGTTSFTYNADGTMDTRTDAKGQTLSYDYDYLGRLSHVKQYFPNNQSLVLRTYTYDANGWGSYLNGRLARVDYGDGKWSELYSYHPAGARTAKRLKLNSANGLSTQYLTLDAFWTYNNEGRAVSVKYPNTTAWDGYGQPFTVNGDTYTYTFDAMARAKDLTVTPGTPGDGSTGTYKQAQGATYGPAGELTALQYLQQASYQPDFNGNYSWQTSYIAESRGYNARMQLSNIGASSTAFGTIANIQYSYYDVAANQSPDLTKNNGKVGQMSQTIGGVTEVVNYKYDSLNRLIAAYTNDTSQWGMEWDYDGFGNRLSQTLKQGYGGLPGLGGANQDTNRSGPSDNNGNLTSIGLFSMTYDVENRMTIAQSVYNGTDNYDYAPDNKRIYKMSQVNSEVHEYVYFYSGSKKLATYEIGYYRPNNQTPFTPYFTLTGANIYFGGKLIQAEGTPVVLDRLGSAVWDGAKGAHRYYPYGEERTSTTNDSTKFGTYFRDKTTGLDYAVNRYFINTMGRFTSPDPFGGSGKAASPGSWNRFAYAGNDPINFSDPLGLVIYGPDEDGCTWDTDTNTSNCPPTEVSLSDYCAANPEAAQCPGGGGDDGPPGQLSSLTPIGGGSGGKAITEGDLLGAKAELMTDLSHLSSDCAGTINRASPKGSVSMGVFAKNMNVLGGSASMGQAGWSNPNNQTVDQYAAYSGGSAGVTLLNSKGVPSNMIGLAINFWGQTLPQQRVTLLHEFLHSYLKLGSRDHSDLVGVLGINKNSMDSNSDAVDKWLANCLK